MLKVPVVFLQLFLCIDVLTWISLVHAIKLLPPKSSVTVFVNNSYVVTCESENDVNVEWYKSGRSSPISAATSNVYNSEPYVEQETVKSRLLFPAAKFADEGHYECRAGKNKVDFDLKVVEHLKLLPLSKSYYALFGKDVELKCALDSNENTPKAGLLVLWRFKDENVQGDHFKKTRDGLIVRNFTEELIGNYTCTYYFTDDDVSETVEMKISLKEAKIPVIKEIYANNTLHVLKSTTANVKCKVTAEPSAKIQWFRNGAELDLRKSNATVENKDNESIMKVYYSTAEYLGNYTCNAWNKFGNTSKTFTLVEGTKPEPPTLSLGKSSDHSCALYIYPIPPRPSLHSVKVFYKNQKLNSSDWSITSLSLANVNPFSLDQLESSSSYIVKVEICSDYEICTFSKDEVCETVAPTTGSASAVMQNIITQFILLLPAFIIGYYSQ